MEYRKGIMKISLAENLRALMCRHLFDKITIKQICDETGVIRATFYNYFDDKYDCLNWIVWHDLVESYLKDIETLELNTYLRSISKHIEDNRTFYRNAYNVTGQNSFEDMVRNNLTLFLKEYLKCHRLNNYMEQYPDDILAMYYSENMAFGVRVLAKSNTNKSLEELVKMGVDLMKNSLFDFIDSAK